MKKEYGAVITVMLATLLVGGVMIGCGKKESEVYMYATVDRTEEVITFTKDPDEIRPTESVEYRDTLSATYIEQRLLAHMGENYWPSQNETSLETFGIKDSLYEEFVYKKAVPALGIDSIVIIKAKEGKAEDVRNTLNAYRDQALNDIHTNPDDLAKIQASEVEVYGNYVVFVELGANLAEAALKAAGNVTEDEAALIEMQTLMEQNEQAMKIIMGELAK